jgi:hypothetical protein
VSGELAADAAERIKTEVALADADLVLWQLGTADAMAQVPVADFHAVVSETVGANAGLGYQIALAGSSFQMPLVFAALLLLAVEGIAMYAVFAEIEVYFTRWAFRSSMSAAA